MIATSTDAAGHAGVPGIQVGQIESRNFDLNASGGAGVVFRTSGWPTARSDIAWRHSDVRNVAYLYTRPFYKFLVELGGLGEDEQ